MIRRSDQDIAAIILDIDVLPKPIISGLRISTMLKDTMGPAATGSGFQRSRFPTVLVDQRGPGVVANLVVALGLFARVNINGCQVADRTGRNRDIGHQPFVSGFAFRLREPFFDYSWI